MANDLTKSPWKVDTASATPLTTDWVYLRNIQWVNPTTAGHEAIVKDASGAIFWHRVAAGARENHETEFHGNLGRPMKGLVVETLGSGTLYFTFHTSGG